MNLLIALQKEKRTLGDRVHNIKLFIEKQSDIISKTAYTEVDLAEAKERLKEVEIAISAVSDYRKSKNNQAIQHTLKADKK